MNHLMKAMLDHNALNHDTVITANYIVKDSSGRCVLKQDDFMMINVQKQGENYRLKLQQLIGKLAITVLANDIVALDGMKPERYVDVYNINPDGSDKSIGKKRGRKPKSNCEMQIA